MILILTTNPILAEGLTALLSSIVDGAKPVMVNHTAAARPIIAEGRVALIIVDGGLSPSEIASFLEMQAASWLPRLLLMESVDQVEVAQRSGMTYILKGEETVELVSVIERLLLG
jgi:hypothetical protein